MNARDRSNHLAALLRSEREAMADFLLALSRFDGDKLWRELGHTSLFAYLRRELGLSAGAAQHRKTAVELIQEYPEVEAALRQGRLCLSSVCELARVVTRENVVEVLPRFFGLSRREAEAVPASIRPAAVVPRRDVVTPVRAPAAVLARGTSVEPLTAASTADLFHPGEPLRRPVPAAPDSAVFDLAVPDPAAPRTAAPGLAAPSPPSPTPAASARPRDVEEPLTGELSRIHITVSRKFMTKLQETKDALSHSHRGATTEEILFACMELMLEKKAKQKGLVKRPLETPRPSPTDHVPAHVRREVMKRSGGRCEWVFENGERCNSTDRVECDHIQPRALGGKATVENTRAAGKGHNLLAARRVFGDEVMDRYTHKRRRHPPREAPSSAACSPPGTWQGS